MKTLVRSVAVAIITCNRPKGLKKLLSSLSHLEFPDFPGIALHVIVVENGRKLEVEEQVDHFRSAGLDVVYAHEATPGITYARNRAMEMALNCAEYLAFIDDDEYPDYLWLNTLLHCALIRCADVVRGPVLAVLPEEAPEWVDAGHFFQRGRYPTGTVVSYGASNNILIKTSLLRFTGLRFNHRFALTGGEDTLFFMQLQIRTGVDVIWSDEAIVYEDVPVSRISAAWLARRASREGSNMPQYAAALGGKTCSRMRWAVQGLAHMGIALLRWTTSLAADDLKKVSARCEFSLGLGMVRGSLGHEVNEYSERHK